MLCRADTATREDKSGTPSCWPTQMPGALNRTHLLFGPSSTRPSANQASCKPRQLMEYHLKNRCCTCLLHGEHEAVQQVRNGEAECGLGCCPRSG